MTKKHVFLMILCCLLPIAGFAAVAIFNVPLNTVPYLGLVLLCPLSHFILMGRMQYNDEGGHSQAAHVHAQNIEPK